MSRLRRFGATLLFLCIFSAEAAADKRVALVIGNKDYTSLTDLNNPVSDASAIAKALDSQGFAVDLHENLDRAAFLDVLDDFRSKAEGAEIALLYYAGHGMELDGKNIIAPVDFDMDCEARQAKRAVPLESLFTAIAPASNQIVLLDSCRNDPFPACKTKGVGDGGFRGIRLETTPETSRLVVNATGSGQLTEDGPRGKHSPFATALLDRLVREPDRFIYLNLSDVSRDVSLATNGRQIPELMTSGGLPEICIAKFGCASGAAVVGGGPNAGNVKDGKRAALIPSEVETKTSGGTNPPAFGPTVDAIKERGFLNCGISTGVPGFSQRDEKGDWQGIDVDFCHAIAAAVLGDGDKIEFLPLSAAERFTALQSGEIDVLVRNSSWLRSREADLHLRFAGTNVYDGGSFMVRGGLGVSSALELSGATVCVQAGTTTEVEVARYFKEYNMELNAVAFEEQDVVTAAYDSGRCDAIAGDATSLYAARTNLSNPEEHIVLPERFTKDSLGPYVRDGDSLWLDIVANVVHALVWAEELHVTAGNVEEQSTSEVPAVRLLLGKEPGLGTPLGLPDDWAYAVIKAVGNYGEIFERNLGDGSPLKMERGLNALATNGGLMIAPPLR